MKVAISLPDDLFAEAERVSKRLRMPRSRLYAKAVEEFVKRHRGKSIGEALEAAYDQESSDLDPVVVDLQRGRSEKIGSGARRDLVGRPSASRSARSPGTAARY